MHLDPLMLPLTGAVLAILVAGWALRKAGQPAAVGYILAGLLIGGHGLGLLTDEAALSRLGAVGILLLLFFVGMEISPGQLAARWKIPVLGTALQILLSIGVIAVLGSFLDWPFKRILLLGFVISLSSTAVVLKLLQERGEFETDVGQNVLGVLLAQDLAVIVMLVIVGFFSGEAPPLSTLVKQVVGGIAMIALMTCIIRRPIISLPYLRIIGQQHEMQVFAAMLLCFGLALIVGVLELPSALGAFTAGMIVHAARETQWVHHSLEPFRVFFVAIFFVSVGMLLDLRFLMDHAWQVALLVLAVFVTNTFINAGIFRALGEPWRKSLYGGAMLAQIGEFSFVLVAAGKQSGVISDFTYQATLATIVISLMISPLWIAAARRLTGYSPVALAEAETPVS